MRQSAHFRDLSRETRVSEKSLVLPLFVVEGDNIRREIVSMPGQYHYSVDNLDRAVTEAANAGVDKFLLFGIPAHKDALGSGAYDEHGVVQNALRAIRRACPGVMLISDVCLCEYTSHGHCGVLAGETVDNDATLPLLAKTALSHAEAGADIVAPSDMMDGRVDAIRRALDENGFTSTAILSYAAKYASAFYGPFREAAGSAPAFGDRRSYQMDCHNRREAVREALLDIDEGADMVMVKPALAYLDVIREVSQAVSVPLAAYSVSGEYAMIKAAAKLGLMDEYAAMCETAACIFRAGAQTLITYYAKELAQAIRKGDVG